jgi:DeoR family transcriptional regulator, glycerol-3-phosphate regulon repressor
MHAEITRRQRSIMEFIREHGSVQVDDLAAFLQVTPQTIRRDLNHLYDLELVQRVHGGAVIKDTVENLGYGARKILMAEEKMAIAKLAAAIVTDNSSMFINIGTTTERVAEFLSNRKGLLVITNNINVASTLWPIRGIEVMIAGGTIRQSDGGIVGPTTEEFVDKFKLDFAVIGCSAIDEHGEFCDYDLREVRVTQSIIRHARKVILVTDSMKMQRRAPVKVGNLSDIDVLVTDDGAPAQFIELCRQTGIELIVAETSKARSDEESGAGQ